MERKARRYPLHFVYKGALFIILDSEDPPRVAPEGMREKLDLYNRLQTEDPERAQAMLAEFMSDEAVVAALGKPVEFTADQIASVEKALAQSNDVRWTFLFLHEPAWENPSESFEAIQQLLKDRRHTFFAGHLHYYDYDNIDGHEHITIGPAGASFHHEGPGNVDHIMWVTMTEDGPKMANIALKGLFDRKRPGPLVVRRLRSQRDGEGRSEGRGEGIETAPKTEVTPAQGMHSWRTSTASTRQQLRVMFFLVLE